MNQAKTLSLSLLNACVVAAFLVAGCDIPQRPFLDPLDSRALTPESSEGRSRATGQVLESPGDPFGGPWEAWDTYFIGDRRVGDAHVRATEDSGKVRYELDSFFVIEQGKSRLLQRLKQSTTETPDGQLVDFQSVLHVGPSVTRFDGAVRDGMLHVQTVRGSSKSTRNVPWEPTSRGLVALEQSLRRRPLTAEGQTRLVRMLLPGQYTLATARLRCDGKASVPLIDGTLTEALEINCEIRVDAGRTESTMWVDARGNILRTYSPALRLVSYRTDQPTTTDWNQPESVATSVASIAIVGKPIVNPATVQRVAFQIRPLQESRPIDIRPAPGQYVRRPLEGDSLQVLVSRRVEKVANGFVASSLAPTEADLKPNHFIDSSASLILRYARAAISPRGNMTDREIAIELARTAHQLADPSPASVGFSKASEVARGAVGDVTGRAVLLAALLRARRIPARLAIGLKYVPGDTSGSDASPQMHFHVWTLAHVQDQWIHLDATEGGLAAADRLIFSTTSLSAAEEEEALVPLLETIGKIAIEVVASQPAGALIQPGG